MLMVLFRRSFAVVVPEKVPCVCTLEWTALFCCQKSGDVQDADPWQLPLPPLRFWLSQKAVALVSLVGRESAVTEEEDLITTIIP